MSKLILKITCGFGNHLFYIFNAISLSLDYNLELIIDTINKDRTRPSFTKYLIFENEKLIRQQIDQKILLKERNVLIKQKGFEYNKIILNPNTNYLIDAARSGFFQSYKFFWHNKDKIKEYINLPNDKFNNMKEQLIKINPERKKLLGIHVRLTDYTKHSSYFYNYPVNYYQGVLSQFDLSEYQIILFSDDPNKASKMLNFLPQNDLILAETISSDDEDQFYLLMLTDVRVVPNSTYSLWTCYLNEIYGFVEAEYWFGNKWFGPLGPKFIQEDLIPPDNPKFKIFNI